MTLLRRTVDAVTKFNTGRPNVGLGTGLGLFGFGATTSTQQEQLNQMGLNAWLFAVIDRIGAATAAVNWTLYREKRTKGVLERTIIDDSHPLKALWDNVNPFYTRMEFVLTWINHYELTGEMWGVILRNNRGFPVELWPVRPDRLKPLTHPTEYIVGYRYQVGGYVLELEPRDVLFIRRPSPVDPYRGIGTVQSLMVAMGASDLAMQWTRNFFRNSAQPGGIIEFSRELSDDQFDRLRLRWQQQHQGVENAHRVALLEMGTWKDRKYTQRDMQMDAMQKSTRDLILGAYGMPLSMLGVTESVNRANAEAGEVMFARWIVRPRLELVREKYNAGIIDQVDASLEMDFEDPVPADKDFSLKDATEGYNAGLYTKNEARAIRGMGESPDGLGDEFKAAPAPAAPAPGTETLALSSGHIAVLKTEDNPLRPDEVNDEETEMEKTWAAMLADEQAALLAHLEEVG